MIRGTVSGSGFYGAAVVSICGSRLQPSGVAAATVRLGGTFGLLLDVVAGRLKATARTPLAGAVMLPGTRSTTQTETSSG